MSDAAGQVGDDIWHMGPWWIFIRLHVGHGLASGDYKTL